MQIKQTINLIQQMGPAWVVGRARYAAQRKLGWLERRCPVQSWDAYRWAALAPSVPVKTLRGWLNETVAPRFVIRPALRESYQNQLQQLLTLAQQAALVASADAVRSGNWPFFASATRAVGWPPRWHKHPQTGEVWPNTHWSKLADLGGSDVKWLWELGRFMPVYALVRAYWLTGDATHAETFWQLVESWRAANPPNQGAHWMCGQEATFRLIACLFGLCAFLDAPATTEARLVALLEMLAAHGARIAGNIGYALAQKNNHGVNEALGLYLLGTLFPVLPASARWAALGSKLLLREAQRQIYPDGAYIQQSMNYHRLVLQSYALALRVSELSAKPLPTELYALYRRAAHWLWQVTDAVSGQVPNYGSNDGATLLALDAADFTDYRPTLNVALWLADKKRTFEGGPCDEMLLWLAGAEALQTKVEIQPQQQLADASGGYYTLRGADTWAFTRCGVYRDRPAQADMLHADLWWRGHNLLADAGTYSYNSPPPWNNGLAATRVHNAVTVNDSDQMERGPRFTWFYWTRGRALKRGADNTLQRNADGATQLFIGEHDGYQARFGVVHWRAILLHDNWLWVIVDDLRGTGTHDLAAQWLMPRTEILAHEGGAYHLQTPVGQVRLWCLTFAPEVLASTEFTHFVGPPDDVRGWFSPRYLQKEPALGLVVTDKSCLLPARRVTLLSLDAEAEMVACALDKVRLMRCQKLIEVGLP